METNLSKKEFEELPLGVVGLGGWLILIQLGLYGTLIMLLVQIINYSIPSISPDIWNTLTSKTSEVYHPLWGVVIIFELLFNVLLFVYCIYILVNLYRKKSIIPRLMIIFYSASLVVGIIDYLLLSRIPAASKLQDTNSLKDIYKSIIACAIWIPYFLKSERVKNTFVR